MFHFFNMIVCIFLKFCFFPECLWPLAARRRSTRRLGQRPCIYWAEMSRSRPGPMSRYDGRVTYMLIKLVILDLQVTYKSALVTGNAPP